MEIATRRREKEVWQACDDLWALKGELKSLTGDAIRERLVSLGKSRGSPNEIYKYRRSWGESRGITEALKERVDQDEFDPITRAVRLVHEKLQQESKDEIESIQREMQSQLSAKEAELVKEKADLLLVMEEFNRAQQENAQLKKTLREQALELEAEIGIRKALEHELALEKKEHRQALLAQSALLSETKAAHQETTTILKDMHDQERTRLMERLEKNECEKKELGHNFSEQLNALKFHEYNLKLQNSTQIQKIEEYKTQIAAHERELLEHKTRAHEALASLASMKVLAAGRSENVSHLSSALEQEKSRFLKLWLEHKKCGPAIARLRALLELKERQWKP